MDKSSQELFDFQEKFTLWHIILTIYIWKTKHKKYLFGLLFREMQKRLMQLKVYYKRFYSVSKEMSGKPLKVSAAKKSFPSVYITDATGFDECFLFHAMTGNIFYTNSSLHRGLVQPPCYCVL